MVNVVRTVSDMRRQVALWRAAGDRVALIPTMGALHEGHLSLIRRGHESCQRSITSIFVNPKQFAAHEDLDTYPKRQAADLEKLVDVGCDLAFIPSVEEMYGEGFSTAVRIEGPALGLETDHRPHFFQGVATVVAKLLIQAGADQAIFGEKDYQQLAVVRQLAADLNIPTEIIGAPTVRDHAGLALSSRNAYLSAAELAIARRLNVILMETAAARGDMEDALLDGRAALGAAGFGDVDYLEARSTTLGPYSPGVEGRLLVAVWLGATRLIDNLAIPA